MQTMDPSHDVCVALCTSAGTGEVSDIDAVQDPYENARFDSSAEEEASDEEHGNGAESREDALSMPDAVEAAADAVLDFCEPRGIPEEKKDLSWNAIAFLCYEQVQNRHGPLYEATKTVPRPQRGTR
jgi:hypothetical protein